MTNPLCPVCQSIRTICGVGRPGRAICLSCGTRWTEMGPAVEPEEVAGGQPDPASERAEEVDAAEVRIRPVNPLHPSLFGRTSPT